VSFKNDAFAATRATSGLADANVAKKSVNVVFTFIFNNTVLQSTKVWGYSVKAGNLFE
jgi:hypothetical protein